ncbi:LytTR family transcriptional regulator DNA-binding domain-containing protein, partial [Lactobacillus crispatus]|nr:LytTR family transcriptional regulator DNA-binding domain-containing protein [Lactobacillus crispatus]
QKLMFNRQLMPLTTNIAESSNITQQRNSSSNISLHNLTVALNLTIQDYQKIDHLEVMDGGNIDVIMKNQMRVQISRRKIKDLKERLGL